MKYYEMHEVVYQKLKEEGKLSWDKSTTFEEMWSHSTNAFLTKFLVEMGKNFSGLQVLDLGTGTGTSALFAAKHGAIVTGVEVSKSAIDIAEKNAKKLVLNVNFIVGDVLNLDLNKKFDLIVDSTILHCIVGESDRKKFYQTVKSHLKPDGLFMVNTMIASGDMENRFPKEYFLFQDDVLWSLGIDSIKDRRVIAGKSYFPHRTILNLENQINEFSKAGFKVALMEEYKEEGEGFDLLALLRLTAL